MSPYASTKLFWDKRFGELLQSQKNMNAGVPYTYPELEEAMQWLAETQGCILDFASGSGAILLRTLAIGGQQGVGFELSEHGVELARRWALANQLQERARFQTGGVEALREMASCTMDGAVLFNILDNILPEDAQRVLTECARILTPGARLLIKLNQDRDRTYFDPERFEELSPGFYRARNGLYLWSLSEEKLCELLEGKFELLRKERVRLSNAGNYHRLYYLQRSV